jgi:hypothetical protein
MNKVKGPTVHWHVTVIFDWKIMAVISMSVLIRLLMK